MRIVSVVAALALALLACGPGRSTFARYPGASVAFDRAAQDPKALEIADKVLAASGGATTWAAAKQLRWSQVVTNDGKQVVAGEQAWDRWNGRHHARAKRDGGDIIVMRTLYEDAPSHAFMDPGENKRWKKIESGADDAFAAAKERWEFDTAILFMPFLLQEPGTKLEYGGEVEDSGKQYDILKVSFDPKDSTRTSRYQIAIDRETHLIARIEIQKAGKSENERLGYGITQWADGGGLKFPGTLQNLGLAGEVISFSGLTVAAPDDTLFIPPL